LKDKKISQGVGRGGGEKIKIEEPLVLVFSKT